MGKLLNIKETASYLNVSQDTLRKWDKKGKLIPSKTPGGHRRYDTDILDKFIGKENKQKDEFTLSCATYARVSSHEQKEKGDLDMQSLRLSEYCAKHKLPITHIIKDVGSGLNDNRSGFIELSDLIIQGKVNKVVIEYKDSLTRFQFKFIKKMFENYGCEVIAINDLDISSEEELATDIISLLASFSGKLYGQRSAERRKIISKNTK